MWLADWCHQLLIVRVHKRFVMTSFFLVAAVAYNLWFFGFFSVTTVNICSPVNKIVLTLLDEYFSATVSNGRVLHGSSLHSLWSMAILRTSISQGSVATRLSGGGIFYYLLTTNLLLSLSMKEIENRFAFRTVSGKNIVAPFLRTGCKMKAGWYV